MMICVCGWLGVQAEEGVQSSAEADGQVCQQAEGLHGTGTGQ